MQIETYRADSEAADVRVPGDVAEGFIDQEVFCQFGKQRALLYACKVPSEVEQAKACGCDEVLAVRREASL